MTAAAVPKAPVPARDPLIGALSGAGILLVVFGHAEAAGFATCVQPERQPLGVQFVLALVSWLQTFHMPLFFAISGYLLFSATLREGRADYAPRALLTAKARRLLAPYVVLSTVAYFPKVWLARYAQHPVGFSLSEYVNGLLLPWHNPIIFFWYLPTLFLMFALAPLTLAPRAGRAREALLLMAAASASLSTPHENFAGPGAVLNAGGVLHNFVFFALGFIAAKRGGLRWLAARPAWCWAAFALSIAACAELPISPASALLEALAGLGAACAFATSRLQRLLARLGAEAFSIYLFSWFPQVVVKLAAARFPALSFTPAVALSFAAGIAVPIAVAYVLDASLPNGIRFLVGGHDPPRELSATPEALAQNR